VWPIYCKDHPEQGTTIAKTRVTADGTYATESVFVSAAGSREDIKYVLESLSKTTKFNKFKTSC
jgi:ribosome-binding factor A